MAIDLEIPSVGESVSEATISQWLKSEGDWVDKDEPVVELETDKVTVELPSPAAGVLVKILKQEGESAEVGDVIGQIDDSAERPSEEAKDQDERKKKREPVPSEQDEERAKEEEQEEEQKEEPEGGEEKRGKEEKPRDEERGEGPRVMPAARRLLEEHDLTASDVEPTGPGGRLLKEDVERHVAELKARPAKEPPTESRGAAEGHEEVVPMSPIRRRIAERLVEAQRQAALLTTFNEVDMSEVMRLRREYRDAFEKEHGIRLGFMSFFVKATVDALRQFPQLNAEVRGSDIVYRNRYDIGIAVSTDRGLVVPVLRQAETLGFSEIEKTIHDFAERGRNSKLKLHELEGGTFTITNGGVFGSMLSTPIVNPPQSGVLGLHAIEERPVAVDGEVVVHPMMYVALTYDHRIVDGREAVTFLKRIKDAIADPARLLLEV